MIVVRDVFHLKYGKAREAKALWTEGKAMFAKFDKSVDYRVMFDLVGPSYTMATEATFKSLADMEAEFAGTFGNEEFEQWYRKFTPLVERGYREIWTLFE